MIRNVDICLKAFKNCIEEMKPIKFILEGVELKGEFNFSLNLSKIEEDYTEFAFGQGISVKTSGKHHEIILTPTKDLKHGMYIVGNISISQLGKNSFPKEIMNLTPADFGECLIKIVKSTDKPQTEEELQKEYQEILQKRDIDFTKGIGNGANAFTGCIFVKNCKITQVMRLGRYEIFPWNGLSCNDELAVIRDFLSKNNINSLGNSEKTLKNCENGQPVFIAHFPLIKADTVESAGELMENEVRMLNNLLAVLRDGYPSIFGELLIDRKSSKWVYKIITPTYTGNLMGGFISGEDPRLIKKNMQDIKNDRRLQLYLSLYNEARKERRIEFVYFRLWNILETIARSKNFEGNPLRDWQGNIIKNNHGNDRKIQDDAKELVLELIRQVFTSSGLTENFLTNGLEQGLISEMVPIWYRHRNCVVHSGGCFPNNREHCDIAKQQYINCKKANDEIISKNGTRNNFTDGYLRALRETVKTILNKELN